MAAGAACAQLLDRPEVEEVEPIGGLERPAELVGSGELSVVEQGAVDRGDGDPLAGGAVARVEVADSVHGDTRTRAPRPPRHGDVDG